MAAQRRPRVAIAVEPTILRDLLSEILDHAGVDEVIDLRADGQSPTTTGAFDAAVVTVALTDQVAADVVIELPDTPTGHGETKVRVGAHSARVPVVDLHDLLRLLDDYCPGERSRATATASG
jgi:hypothetical protein